MEKGMQRVSGSAGDTCHGDATIGLMRSGEEAYTLLSSVGRKLIIAPRFPAAAMVKMSVVQSQKGP